MDLTRSSLTGMAATKLELVNGSTQHHSKLKVALLLNKRMYEQTFAPDAIARLETFAEIVNRQELPDTIDDAYILNYISQAEAVITCWGTPKLRGSLLETSSSLRVIAHTAGTPRAIIDEDEWPENVRIVTAAPVIAIDVAETALWAMIDLLKYMNEHDRRMKNGEWLTNLSALRQVTRRLNYRLKVGIVSASHVGRNMIRLLHPFGVTLALYDPYLSEDEAIELRAKIYLTNHKPSLGSNRSKGSGFTPVFSACPSLVSLTACTAEYPWQVRR